MTRKLNNLSRNSKSYWSLLNNKTTNIPLISPLFYKSKFATNFLEKAELFNSIFSKQCFLINKRNTLPTHTNI